MRPCSHANSVSGSEEFKVERAFETAGGAGRRIGAGQADRVAPGARKSSRSMVQDLASACKSAARFCSGRPPSMICSELNSICAGIGACGSRAISARSPGSNRIGSAACPCPSYHCLGEELVGVELPRRQHRMKQRRGAEADIAQPGEFQRRVVGAVVRLDLFEPRGGWIGLDLGRYPPRRRTRRGRLSPSARPEPIGSPYLRSAARGPRSGARLRGRPTRRARRDRG